MSDLQDIAETHSERALVLLAYLDSAMVFASAEEMLSEHEKIASAVGMLAEEIRRIHAEVHKREVQR